MEKELKKLGKPYTDAQLNEIISSVAKRIGINNADDFYNTIGFGGLSLQRFIPKIKELLEKLTEDEQKPITTEEEVSKFKTVISTNRTKSSGGVIIDGEAGCHVKFAKCCNPLPGDKIVGFVTRGFGVSVHKTDCPNVVNTRRNEENLARWVRAEWEKSEAPSELYEAKLQIIASDEIGVLAAISVTLADMKVSITQINTQAQKNGNMAINISVGCKNTSHYESIVSKLRSLRSIISVTRAFSQ